MGEGVLGRFVGWGGARRGRGGGSLLGYDGRLVVGGALQRTLVARSYYARNTLPFGDVCGSTSVAGSTV